MWPWCRAMTPSGQNQLSVFINGFSCSLQEVLLWSRQQVLPGATRHVHILTLTLLCGNCRCRRCLWNLCTNSLRDIITVQEDTKSLHYTFYPLTWYSPWNHRTMKEVNKSIDVRPHSGAPYWPLVSTCAVWGITVCGCVTSLTATALHVNVLPHCQLFRRDTCLREWCCYQGNKLSRQEKMQLTCYRSVNCVYVHVCVCAERG